MAQTAAQKFIRDGRQAGLEEGRPEATQDVLLDPLNVKFGDVPGAIELRLRSIKDRADRDPDWRHRPHGNIECSGLFRENGPANDPGEGLSLQINLPHGPIVQVIVR